MIPTEIWSGLFKGLSSFGFRKESYLYLTLKILDPQMQFGPPPMDQLLVSQTLLCKCPFYSLTGKGNKRLVRIRIPNLRAFEFFMALRNLKVFSSKQNTTYQTATVARREKKSAKANISKGGIKSYSFLPPKQKKPLS
ncbi:hypothetical protein TNCV_578791 [Trichonephila clavipes]|nr:hypothetical protein TNCV_578791 [Trichonephila clavipes]